MEAYKIGSGECNNYPLISLIASFGKPVILSTGMNDLASIEPAVVDPSTGRACHSPCCSAPRCIRRRTTRFGLGAIPVLRERFPDAVIGLSDHSIGNYACFGAVALGASILEKHFTSDKTWPGPDIQISIDPEELRVLIEGSRAIHAAMGGTKDILREEQPTIDFAYASVVSIRAISEGETFSGDNIWVKRPGTGEILAAEYEALLGKVARRDIGRDVQIRRADIG